MTLSPRHLVLIGAGHAHLFVLEAIAGGRLPPGTWTTLVAPGPEHVYSGMLTGFLAGRYRSRELTFDLAALARGAGAEFVAGSVTAIDPAARELQLDGGRRLNYDVASLAIGGGVAGDTLPGVKESVIPMKPIDHALDIAQRLSDLLERPRESDPRVIVVGAGVGGVEIALTLRARLRGLGRPNASVAVVDGHRTVLRGRSTASARAATEALARNRVGWVLGSEVTAARQGVVRLASGAELPADLIIWATGARAPEFFAESGLATDSRGFLLVDDTLRSVSHPTVFAAGDAATLRKYPDTPKSGVYAVRQGPILCHNLAVALGGHAKGNRHYRPQKRSLVLLNTGDGRAILSYGGMAITSRWAMALKDRIDRRFMRRFQAIGS